MTGRAAGFCAGNAVPGCVNPIPGRGYGVGRGRGVGFGRGLGWGMRGGRGFFGGRRAGWGGFRGAPQVAPGYLPGAAMPPYGTAPSAPQEAEALKSQAEYFEDALHGIRMRIAELDAKPEETK